MPYADPAKHREYQRNRIRRRAIERPLLAETIMGSRVCSQCWTVHNIEAHHVDRSTKKFKLSSGLSCSDKVFIAEAKKCIWLCSTCHSSLHAEEQRQYILCQKDDCTRLHRARGLCNVHYEHQRLRCGGF